MKMTVSHGLGVIAVLAVSGTALYLVYESKRRKASGSIRRGNGALRLAYRIGSHGPPEQQRMSETKDLGKEGRGLRDGDEVDIYCQHSPCLRRAADRQSERQLKLLAAASGSSRMIQDEDPLVEVEIKCKVDKAEIEPGIVENTLSRCSAEDQDQECRGDPLPNSSAGVDFIDKRSDTDSFGALSKSDHGSSDSLSSTDDSEEFSARSTVDASVLQTSSSSSDEECSAGTLSLAAVSSLPAPSSAAAPPPPRSFAIVGRFVHSGSGSAAVKRKKVVRFSPSVTEPSSNNQDYRRRCKAQLAQKAARNGHQKSHIPSSTAVRSSAYDRPRFFSQPAKQAITYSVHRADHRYGGRSY